MRSWNVVVDAACRGLRRTCAVALVVLAVVHAAPAQMVEFEGTTAPPDDVISDQGSFVEESPDMIEEPIDAAPPDMMMYGPADPLDAPANGMMLGPPPRTPPSPGGFYYPPGAEGQGMPAKLPTMLWPSDAEPEWHGPFSKEPPWYYSPCLARLGFRYEYTHGRNVGWGWPMGGTSWMNRPYYLGVGLGPIWLTRPMGPHVTLDTDTYANFVVGWDWEYYWGSEFEFGYATPEVRNRLQWDAHRGDRLHHFSYNLFYYPWGDSALRPYWRFGLGGSEFDYPTDDGHRIDEVLLTFPWGIGVKYPFRKTWAIRTEVVDYWSIGHSNVDTQHNIAWTFGIEWRFGVRSKSYWPWNPTNEIW